MRSLDSLLPVCCGYIVSISYNLQFQSALAAFPLSIICNIINNLPFQFLLMDDLDTYLRDQQPSLATDEDQLERLSATVRSLVELPNPAQLTYEEFLHLQVRIDQTRERILRCNLAIAESLAALSEGIKSIKRQEEPQLKKQQSDIGCFAFSEEKEQTKDEWLEENRLALQEFKKILTMREVQLSMLLFVLQYRSKPDFKELYNKNFGEVMQFMIPYEDCQRKLNIPILDDLFKKQMEYLRDYLQLLGKLMHFREYLADEHLNPIAHLQVQTLINKLKIAHSKVKTISEVFPFACVKEIDDLFSVNQLHPRWQNLLVKERITYVALSDQLTLEKSFQDIKENLNVINAAMSIMDRHKKEEGYSINKRMAIFYQNSINILKCALSKKQAKFQAEVMISQAKDDLAKQIWNLPQNRKFRQFIALCLPSITFSVVYYLPRTYKDYFYQRYNSLVKEAILPSSELESLQQYKQKLLQKKPYQQSIRIRINCSSKLQHRMNSSKLIKQQVKGKESIMGNINDFFGSMTKLFKNEGKTPKAIILHIHGGGFISMSSFIHQTYTRKWANELGVPIVSVDYGKAPSRPFPEGLYDCFEAYMWVLNIFSQVFQALPERIILVGDSAGGNLVAALTTLLIEWGLPKPSGIVLVYPALNLSLANYTPSLLTALNDMILPHTFLKLCANAYLGQSQQSAETNPFISPVLTSDSTLSKYPPTQIFVGNKDPFHDDCCRFIQRLCELNSNDNHLTIFQEFPHGFLQFDLKLMPNEYSRQATKRVQKALERLLA